MKKPFIAVALCGGIGKRFWPLSTNKVLFPFLGNPLIDYTVFSSLPPQIDKLIIIASLENYSLLKSIKTSIPTEVVLQEKSQGMADAVLSAKQYLKDSSLLIYIADHFVENKLLFEIADQSVKDVFAILPGLEVNAYLPYAYYKLSGNVIIDIVEKPQPGTEPSKFVDITGHYISDANIFIETLEKTQSDSDDVYEKALSTLMQNHQVIMHTYKGRSSSLKYPWDVLSINKDLLETQVKSYRGKNCIIKNNVIIEGEVYIGDNVKIFENTKITGPVYIGNNTVVGNNNIIRESHIGSNCVTGFNTDITRSYVGDNCWFHSNYIGDSVLEGNVSLGSGTVLANLKLDESEINSIVKGVKVNTRLNKLGSIIGKNVRTGVNTSIMPGVKIGSNTMIGAGCLIKNDVPDNSFCVSDSNVKINQNIKKVNSGTDREKYKNKI